MGVHAGLFLAYPVVRILAYFEIIEVVSKNVAKGCALPLKRLWLDGNRDAQNPTTSSTITVLNPEYYIEAFKRCRRAYKGCGK